MLIISNFTDYYDYIPKQYGIDKKVVYNRNIKLPKQIVHNRILTVLKFDQTTYIKYLIFCGQLFLLVSVDAGYTFTLMSISDFIKKYRNRLFFLIDQFLEYEQKSFKQKLILLSKQVGTPVFIINDIDYINKSNRKSNDIYYKLDINIPCLNNISGFSQLIPPQTAYQELYYFIINVINNNPDIVPPVEVNNTQKIIQHGFDLKQSFRPKFKT